MAKEILPVFRHGLLEDEVKAVECIGIQVLGFVVHDFSREVSKRNVYESATGGLSRL